MVIHKNFPLCDILFYRIGGSAKTVLEIHSKEDLHSALAFLEENKDQNLLPVGLGANLLVNDSPFDGIILWFAKPQESSIKLQDNAIVEAFASETLDDVIQFSFQNRLTGLEWAGGLPSSVGGAVRGNVGCFGKEIKDVVFAVEVVDLKNPQKGFIKLGNTDCEFSYRNSVIKQNKNLIISRVYFQLAPVDQKQVDVAKRVYDQNIAYREKNHPIEFPSCGSIFKNMVRKEDVDKILEVWADVKELSETKWHNKIAMGYVINRMGFSGYQLGGAKVSEKHCNYISNVDYAKFDDVYAIIEKIKQKFHTTFNFYPELEVEIVQ